MPDHDTGSMATIGKRRIPAEISELPGPSGIPLVGNLHQIRFDRLHVILEDWADRFGPLYGLRLGPHRSLVLSDCDEIQRLLAERPDGFRRPRNTEAVAAEMKLKGVFVVEGDEWRRHRRIVIDALNRASVENFFPKLAATVARLQRRWERAADSGERVDLCRDLMRFTVDVTTQLAFGIDVNTLETSGATIQRHLDKVFPAVHRRELLPFPYWRYFRLPRDRALDRALDAIEVEIGAMITAARERLEREPECRRSPGNFLEAIIAAQEAEDSAFSEADIIANVGTLLLAGEDTTANSIAWMIHFLTEHRDWVERCRSEVDGIVGASTGIEDFEDTKRLRTIDAVCNETMRMKPVAPLLILESVTDTQILGCRVPRDTMVFMLPRRVATQDEHFVDGHRFDPERWLLPQEELRGPRDHRAFVPFGAGPRFCPGRNLALLEIRTVLAMLLRNFEVFPANDDEVEERIEFTMFPKNLLVRFERRNQR